MIVETEKSDGLPCASYMPKKGNGLFSVQTKGLRTSGGSGVNPSPSLKDQEHSTELRAEEDGCLSLSNKQIHPSSTSWF